MNLGLDISTARTGWALIEPETKNIYMSGFIMFSPKDSFQDKVGKLYNGLIDLFEKEDIQKVGIEDQFFGFNVLTLKILSRFSGIACLVAFMNGATVEFYPVMTIKKEFTGKGNATKEETKARVLELYGADIAIDDMTDAISIAWVTCITIPEKIKKKKKRKKKGSTE